MRTLILAVVAVITTVSSASAQSAAAPPRPLVRADVAGNLAWSNIQDHRQTDTYDKWFRALQGGVTAGWYWTDHLKTEVEFGASRRDETYRSFQITIDGYSAFESARVTLSRRSLGVGQHYQFFRNAWFHPFLAGGLDLSWDTERQEFQPVVIYQPARQGEVIRPARTIGPQTTFAARAFAGGGFKAYMTPRSFFRSDVRVSFRAGDVDQVLWRFGFGVDF